jgi:hypothetical protein
MKLLICIMGGVLMLPLIAFGQMDSVIIGSINVDSGSGSAIVPIWVTTVDTVETIVWHLCLRSVDEDDARFANIEYYYPLNSWDVRFDTLTQNGRVLGIIAFAQTDPGPGPNPLFTNNQRWNILTLRILLNPAMPSRQIIVDSLSSIHIGRDGTVFVPGAINSGLMAADEKTIVPEGISLLQNYPNPFNAQTLIQYNLAGESDVSLTVFDILGRQVETLIDGYQNAGPHQVIWDAENSPSGIYFYMIKADNSVETKRMTLIR